METPVGLSQLAGLFCNKVLSFWNEDQVLQKWAGGDRKSCVWGPAPKGNLIFPDPGRFGSHTTWWPRVRDWKWGDEKVVGRAVLSSMGVAGNQKRYFLGEAMSMLRPLLSALFFLQKHALDLLWVKRKLECWALCWLSSWWYYQKKKKKVNYSLAK